MSYLTAFFALLLYFAVCAFGQYEVPDALVETYSPKGFRISIPDQEGIKLFAIHAKLNEEMNGREAGTYSSNITSSKNGRWTFIDKTTELKIGDIFHYWTYVDYLDGGRKLGYIKFDQTFTVTQLIIDPTAPTTENSNCVASITKVTDRNNVCAGNLIFQENFSGNYKDKWQTENKFARESDYEFVLYTDSVDNIWVEKNMLHVKPTIVDEKLGVGYVELAQGLDLGVNCTGIPGTLECVQMPQAYLILPPVQSARINTKNSFSFIYGKIEIRAKLPKGDWIYPELYLNSKHEDYGSGYESGQIRLAFVAGNNQLNNKLSGGCILGPSVAARSFAIRTMEKDKSWTDDFHIFSVKWEPTMITLFVDGEMYGTICPPLEGFAAEKNKLKLTAAEKWKSGTLFAPFDKEMYISIGVGVGGHSFPDSDTKPWINNDPKFQRKFYRAKELWHSTWGDDSTLQVDYITVTAL